MKPQTVTIVGCGAHARKVAQAVISAGGIVERFLDDRPDAVAPLAGIGVQPIASQPIRPMEQVVVAIGDPTARRRVAGSMASRGFRLATIVHSFACVAPDATLGVGVTILAGAIIEGAATICDGAIIDVGAIIDHDAYVSEFAHVRPGSVVAAYAHWPASATAEREPGGSEMDPL